MRLAALFIEDFNYEFGGYTLNFGGDYHYDVKFGDGNTRITKTKNENFIDTLFDDIGTVTNISAIVGNNGSGKTSTISKAINVLNKKEKGIAFWELDDRTLINHYNTNLPKIKLEGDWETGFIELDKPVGTVYYSPYLDHKLGVNGIDISADRYLREDLVNLDSTFEASSKVIISDRLKRADYKRFISFQKSEFSEKIKEKYGLFNDNRYRVVFTRHKINTYNDSKDRIRIKFEHTPIEFQSFLDDLFFQIQEEYKSLDRDEEIYDLNKKQFKNFLLMDVFCLLIKLMEKNNKYLLEGHFEDEKELDQFLESKPDAKSILLYWLDNYYYSKGKKYPLPGKEIKAILDFLFDYIDSLNFSKEGNFLNWEDKSLLFDEDKLNQLLDLNENLLISLNKYYNQKSAVDDYADYSISDIQHFVSVEFAKRTLSSGETALLNLYSRIYDYFSRHIINYPITTKKDFYILFLDEADLGYHPSWKRTFVNSLIDFTSDFFTKLEVNVQIVFTTHDPLTLSDIQESSVIYLKKEDDVSRILSYNDLSRPQKTFGANIHELLAESFFIGEGLIGDFAKGKIQDVIEYIRDENRVEKKWISEPSVAKKLIDQIGEPYLNDKLNEMFLEAFPEYKEDEIVKLEAKLKQLRSDTTTNK